MLKNQLVASKTMRSKKNFNITDKPGSRLFRYDLLNEVTREGIWDYNTETLKSNYNENMITLFGYALEEMEDNKTWWEKNIHPEDRLRVISEMNGVLNSTGNTWYGEYLFRCKNGQYKPVLERLYVVRDHLGKALLIVGTMQDLSPLKQVREQIDADRKAIRKQVIRSVYETEEHERKFLSDELHENISQSLAFIHMQMTLLRSKIPAEESSNLDHLEELLLDSLNGTRVLSNRLYPFGIEIFGIKSLLVEQLEKFNSDFGLEYDLFIGSRMIDLSMDKQAIIFKIIVEHLKNIGQHASAKYIWVRLEEHQDNIKLTITDDGRGADFNKLKFGGGISKVHYITEAYDGSYSITTEPGKGFTLEVIL
jgi:PAS domain S-box-containing protein